MRLSFFQQKGHENEYQYVKVIAQWYVSSDRRRITQPQRRYNKEMLNYILDASLQPQARLETGRRLQW